LTARNTTWKATPPAPLSPEWRRFAPI